MRLRSAGLPLLFILGLLAGPLVADAQQAGKVYRIGILETIPAARNAANLDALRKGLRDLGYVEGRNLVIEYRSADGRAERFPDLAAELVRLKVDLIVTRGTPAARAAKKATETIPTVMATMGDPHAIVASFAHPGGNITGVTTFSTELTGKRIELLKELVPRLSRVALLHNMGNPAAPPEWEETKTAARLLGLKAELLDVRNEGDLGRAFELAVQRRVDALVIGADGLTQMHQQTIVDFVARNRLPSACRGIDSLRGELPRYLFPVRKLHRQDLQGREARRASCGTAHQVRTRDQRQDCQGPRPDDSAVAAAASRSSDSIGARPVCAQVVPKSSAFLITPAHSSTLGRRDSAVRHQTVTRSYTFRGIGLKILVSAVQSRPCPPFFQPFSERPFRLSPNVTGAVTE